MSQTLHLYQLQSLDSEIDQTRQRLKEVAAQLGESEALQQAKASVEKAEANLRKAQVQLQNLDLELKSLTGKISNEEKKLYGGKVSSAKEAANLQEEVASLKRRQSDREEHVLEAMVKVDEAEAGLERAKAQLAATQTAWATDQHDLIQERDTLKQKLADLINHRPVITQNVPATDLNLYEKLRPKKAGRPVAHVKNGVCQGCGVEVPNNLVRQARAGGELVYCSTCGRILYVP